MNIFKYEGHADSLLPEGSVWKLVWNDEFDGDTLDGSKWDYRMSMMQQRWPAWTDKGVHLDGRSNCVFTLLMEDGRPVSSQLQTGYNFMDTPLVKTRFGNDHLQWTIGKLNKDKFLKKYGYFECRCRLQKRTDAWWSAFWIQSPTIGADADPAYTGTEIDVMECFTAGRIAGHNAITGGYGLDMVSAKTGGVEGLDMDAWHYFGLLWDETGYTFYVNGVEDGKIEKYISRRPQFILISTEVKGYRGENHQPVAAAFDAVGDTFLVDHVRVFDRV